MLDPVGEEGEVGLQEGCCVAQHSSQLSDCEGPLLGRSLKAKYWAAGLCSSLPPVPQGKRQK